MHRCSWAVAGMWLVSLVAITVGVYPTASSGATPQSNGSPLDPRHWTHFVRIGGYGLSLDRVDDAGGAYVPAVYVGMYAHLVICKHPRWSWL